MRYLYILFIILTTCSITRAQRATNKGTAPVQKHFVIKKQTTVNFSAVQKDFNPKLMLREMPKQGSAKMEQYNYPEKSVPQAKSQSAILPNLVGGQSFFANPWGVSTPNDNDMAISNSGQLVSVQNTNIFIRNTVTNSVSPVKSLAAFTTPINSLHQEFDPKVMYDPLRDRFVLVCLVGFVDTTSKIIVGFTQTNDPNGNWNLYTLPGDPLNVGLWSDYPMISMTEKELFLSVNYLYNDSSWQTGFVETLVWQMKKDSGYAGLPIGSVLHSNIKFNGKAIRNLCPAKGGSNLKTPNMYFVSNRNLASQNDSVFLVNVTDTIGAPTLTVTSKVMIASQPYYFPPPGRQPTAVSQSLATNDSRNLGAFYENNKIQYVHNTKNPANNLSTVYYGIIDNPAAASPTVTGYMITNDTMDFAYPNISYAGNGPTDDNAIINFDHTSDKVYAGISAIRADGLGDFSPKIRIQNGATWINLLAANLERWGDYSGSQRRYNYPGEVWVSGYYGYTYSASYPRAHGAWVTQLVLNSGMVTHAPSKDESANSVNVFPNPANDIFTVEIDIPKQEYLSFEILDAQGKVIHVLLRDWVKVKQNSFSFSTRDLAKGIYFLKISGNNNTNIMKKIVLN
ncbi:MAG: hypothetical protein K0S32_1550 [Bacteroidetes bacterium]|jgi:hypothetical protein|nr:hypothetical protein [Bacteroidota bacterium]